MVIGLATLKLPEVSLADVRRFDKVVTVRDRAAFRAELNRFMRERLASFERSVGAVQMQERLQRKANALKAQTAWAPSATDVQRGRVAMLHEFSQPQNLPLTEFAKLANKSRQQIYKDIAAKRLLALSVGTRGQRLPDWQLDSTRLRLTQAVLTRADDVDAWALFQALSNPCDALRGQSPVNAVRPGNLADVLKAVLNALGNQGQEQAFDVS